jgi:hypothetical protein
MRYRCLTNGDNKSSRVMGLLAQSIDKVLGVIDGCEKTKCARRKATQSGPQLARLVDNVQVSTQ